MATNNTSSGFMSKLSRYVGNITGSAAYWHRVREDLKAIIDSKGVPTIFLHFQQLTCIIGLNRIHFFITLF